MQWYTYAFIGMICITVLTLLLTKITRLESSTILINLYLFCFTLVGFLILAAGTQKNLIPSKYTIILLIICSIIAVVLNFALIESYRLAPNPGYARAIVTVSAGIVALLAIFTLGAKVSIVKLAGVGLIVVGMIALLI